MHLSRLKMSHAEMKQEHKEVEGNSEVKAKIRVRMREMSRRRMQAAVPKADLVVMNPTHYAVALKYDDTKMAAPRVVAKGADLLALSIRDSAKSHQVPVLQAPVLGPRAVRALPSLDREIPAGAVLGGRAGAGLRVPAACRAGRTRADARRAAVAAGAGRARSPPHPSGGR
jgi:flagellar biosynthetic protein FlhB